MQFLKIYFDQKKRGRSREKYYSENQKVWRDKIVTEISPLISFFQAEEYHQEYLKRNPENMYCQVTIKPKYEKFKSVFSSLLKE